MTRFIQSMKIEAKPRYSNLTDDIVGIECRVQAICNKKGVSGYATYEDLKPHPDRGKGHPNRVNDRWK